MKIPKILKTKRFYVAINHKHAYSSWPSAILAQEAWIRIVRLYPEHGKQIKGILRVMPEGQKWLPNKRRKQNHGYKRK